MYVEWNVNFYTSKKDTLAYLPHCGKLEFLKYGLISWEVQISLHYYYFVMKSIIYDLTHTLYFCDYNRMQIRTPILETLSDKSLWSQLNYLHS